MPNTTASTLARDTRVRVLKTEVEYRSALAEAEGLVVRDPAPHSPDGERLELLTLLIEHYESERFHFETPDPIEAIEFRMEEQSLRQKDLVQYIGSRSRVSEVLARKRPLTVQMIRRLSAGLGIPLETLVGSSELLQDRAAPEPKRLDWKKLPYKEMGRRGWFDDLRARVGGSVEEVIAAFFLEAGASQALFRRRLRGEQLDERAYYAALAWSARVILRAKAVEGKLATFERGRINKDVLRDLARLSWLDEGPRLAEGFLAKLGIALVVEPKLSHGVLDGAALLTESRIPVVGLTLRIDRLDYFWFTLLHEVAHVWRHLEDPTESYVDRLDTSENDAPAEREANRLAKEAFVPLGVWKRSGAFLNPSRETVQELADQMHISPAVVAGRVQFETGRYDGFRDLLGQGRVRRLFPDASVG